MKVSVIVPTWNRGHVIEKAVRSVLNQSMRDFEILVCDDGSTDGTREKILALADSRIRWVAGPHGGRPAMPRNRGLAAARGEWLAFLDSDDEWLPNKLEKQLALLEATGLKATCSNALRSVPGETARKPFLDLNQTSISFADLLVTNEIVASSVVFHRSLLPIVGGFPEQENLAALEDYALWLRLASRTDFAYAGECLVVYRDDPENSVRGQNQTRFWRRKSLVIGDFLAWSKKRGDLVSPVQKIAFFAARLPRLGKIISVTKKKRGFAGTAAGCGTPSVAVGILFFNKIEQTIECLESVLPAGTPVYVLNNGSEKEYRDRLGEFCRKYPRQINILDSAVNLGVGGGRNELIRRSAEDWILFLDNDITVKTSDWLPKIMAHVRKRPGVEVFIPRLYSAHDRGYAKRVSCAVSGHEARFRRIFGRASNVLSGGASFISRRLFDRLGLYDERIFVGFEELELVIRAVRQNATIAARYVRDVELLHEHRFLEAPEEQRAVRVRYDTRSVDAGADVIAEKYGVRVSWNYGPWHEEQVEQMTKKGWKAPPRYGWRKLKQRLASLKSTLS